MALTATHSDLQPMSKKCSVVAIIFPQNFAAGIPCYLLTTAKVCSYCARLLQFYLFG